MVHPRFSMYWALIVVGRSVDEIRGTCDDRIDLYPAAPVRLATMLYARTISWSGTGLIWGAALSPNRHPAIHPTCQRAPRAR